MPAFQIGQRISHPECGDGTVVFVGSQYVGIALDNGRDMLLRMETFECAPPDEMIELTSPAEAEPVRWPD